MDRIQRMARYRPSPWAARAPKKGDEIDGSLPLGLAANVLYRLYAIDQKLTEELVEAKGRYTVQGLTDAIPQIVGKYREELDKLGNGPIGQIERARERLLDAMKGADPDLDAVTRELRSQEVRRVLAAELAETPEAGIEVSGGAAVRWIVSKYQAALEAGDLVTAHALENVPSIFPEAMRLRPEEIEANRLARAEAAFPGEAQEVRDLTDALDDLAQLGEMIDGAAEKALEEARRNAPAEPENDPGVKVGGQVFHRERDSHGGLHAVEQLESAPA